MTFPSLNLFTNALEPSTKALALSQMAILSAKNAQSAILAFCFSQGPLLNPELVNNPLLYTACDSSYIAVFEVLLNNGLSVNQHLESSGDPLTSSCYSGHVELATYLLDRGANPNSDFPCGDYCALVWAVIGDRGLDLVRVMLKYGAEVEGTGALIAAAEIGKLGEVQLLLGAKDVDLYEVEEYGGYDPRKVNDMGTALYKAAAKGHLEIVDALLRCGADVRFKDRKGRSVKDVAGERTC